MKVTVNDVSLDLKPGTSVIDALFAAGFDVPYFCSQEYMSPIGACRMCLARVGAPRKGPDGQWIPDDETGEPKIFYFPNLMATCTTAVMEGMVVDTVSDDVVSAQNGMVEFTLINHPLDCPVCDKGGACELQDRAYEYGTGLSRFQFDKRHQEKHAALSELITLDRERCIHCKRCVRYFEEVPGDEVLDFIERGGHTYIGTVEDGLPSNFSGNITDICPVGALLDTTSRFRGRNWEFDHTRTTSLDDASGSAVIVDARTGRIERVKAGLNPEVNKTWIDDSTRFGHEYVDAEDRLRSPLVRRGDRLVPTSWEDAASFIAERLAGIDNKQVGIVLRADATLEEGVAAKALAEQLGTGKRDHYPRTAASLLAGGNPATLEELAVADAIFVVGDPTEEVPIVDLRIKDALKGVPSPELLDHGVPIADLRLKERMPRKRQILTVAAPYRVDLMKHAGTVAVYPAGQESELFNALRRLASENASENGVSGDNASEPAGEPPEAGDGGFPAVPGMSDETARGLVERLKDAKHAVVVYGAAVLASREASEAVLAFSRAVEAKTMALPAMANSYGLEAIDLLPSHARYGYPEMLAGGELEALIVSNLDPGANRELSGRLAELKLLVVHSSFPNESTELAHVVLPAKTGYEKDGTVVNLEGRVLPVYKAPVDGGASEDFTGVVKRLGVALGNRMDGRSVRSARRVLKRSLGIDPAALPLGGERLSLRARATARVSVRGPDRQPGNLLLIPSMIRHEYLSRNPHLRAAHGEAPLRLNPADAGRLGLRDGDTVTVPVDGVERRAAVMVTESAPEGLPLLPALPDQPAGSATADFKALRKERFALEVA
ncbi:MAG: NADH-quinone oxidoreductase subunit NuoG [Trueperaceae bacterium]